MSVVWRRAWESGCGDSVKQKLINYNTEDMAALRRVTECIAEIVEGMGKDRCKADEANALPPVVRAEDIPASMTRREFGRGNFASLNLNTSTSALLRVSARQSIPPD